VVEATARLGGLLEPARHGVPRETLEPSDRGDADALDSESDNLVERSPRMLEAVIRRAQRLRKRLSTLNAAVSTAPPGPRSVETVADDASSTDLSMQRTIGIETTQLPLRVGLVDERTATSEIGLKLYHPRELGTARQHLIAEAPFLDPIGWGYAGSMRRKEGDWTPKAA
jgi:hypothetical protein